MSEDCSCVDMMNEALKSKNAKISEAIGITKCLDLRSWICVGVEKIDKSKRKALPVVMANYCPFCGKSLLSEEDKEAVVVES